MQRRGFLATGALSTMAAIAPAWVAGQTSDGLEQVIRIPKPGLIGRVTLEATLFFPQGAGPFPLVVINHGKAPGDPKFQTRYRPLRAARWFNRRGWLVVAPMRQGFARSEGYYIGGGCNVESNGRAQAEDVAATIAHLSADTRVDASRILVAGQSHGGWTTLAYGASHPAPGVRGLINFAGGLRQETCSAWESTLVRAAGGLGADCRLPSLWFYGDNDSFFAPPVWRGMHEAYTRAGGAAELIAFGIFGQDAHAMFGSRDGDAIWQPEVTRWLRALGLPHDALADAGGLQAPPFEPETAETARSIRRRDARPPSRRGPA